MKTPTRLRSFQLTVFLIVLAAIAPSNAEGLSPELLRSWEETWNRVVDRAMGGYLERAAAGSLSTLDAEPKTQALEELAELLYSGISWEALGDAVTQNMRAECGDDVLTGMEPYFIDRDPGRIDPATAQAYGQCAQTAIEASIQLLASAIEAKLEKVSAVHAKFGIDYP